MAGDGYAIQVITAAAQAQTTNSFNVSAAQATQVVITSPPIGTVSTGAGFGVAVEITDQFGNVVTAYSGIVNVALANNPGGSTLSGGVPTSVSPSGATRAKRHSVICPSIILAMAIRWFSPPAV